MASVAVEELKRVKQAVLDLGSEWTGPTADKVLVYYEKSLEAVKGLVGQTTVHKDLKYGSAERNVLDVYVPASNVTFHGKRPCLIYFHGGGFFAGDKAWSETVYSNIGYYLASHGIVTVLANYQLVPACKYPAPADDVQLVREWVHKNISSEIYGSADAEKVILVGQSAGGAHVATNLYAAGDAKKQQSASPAAPSTTSAFVPPLAGVAYLSVPFYFDHTKARRAQTLREYYGSDQPSHWEPYSPLGLFKALGDESETLDAAKLPVLVVIGQLDPKEIVDANVMYFDAYRAKSKPRGILPATHVLTGHNHISNVISIGTDDDVQGQILLDFVHRTCF